jgi:hypothetical protein
MISPAVSPAFSAGPPGVTEATVAGIQGHWSVRRSSIGPKLIQRSSPPIRQPDSCSAPGREFGRNHLLTYAMSVLMRQSPHQ